MTLTPRGKIVTALLVVAGLLVGAAGAGYLYLRSIGTFGTNEPGRPVSIVIPEGSSALEIGELLESEGVIKSTLAWRIALFLEGGGEDIEAGNYDLFTDLTAPDALGLLSKGASVDFVTVTFPEGSWLEDFARIVGRDTHIARAEFTEALESGEVTSELKPDDVDTLEGLLFPSTYQVIEKDTAVTLAQRIVTEFEKQVAAVDFAEVEGFSPYEVVIIASMIEAEAKVDGERRKIASVIYNRLEVGEKLGIDATVLYALGEHKDTLTVSELAVDSPYNTRLYAGLPPTPIGAPGIESLRAAADPAPGDLFFYVVSDCEGHHAFSETAAQFARDKAAYQALECPN